jgi:LmbE family N-acetylglucosaminyl deacetylase
MNLTPKRVLVLSPHTDDGEFGCGATLAKWIGQGSEVFSIAFSSCEESVPAGLPKDTLIHEAKDAAKALSIPTNNLTIFNYRVRRFSYTRQEILEDMVRLRKDISPDLVMLPSKDDLHQDHLVVAQEGLRAFKHSTVLGYEIPWNNRAFQTTCFCKIDEQHLVAKLKALQSYKSQQFRNYASEDFVRSLARVRGVQAGVEYAESFEVQRLFV